MHPLDGPRAKVKRAFDQFQELQSQIGSLDAKRHADVSIQFDQQTGWTTAVLHLHEPLPADLGIRVGEFANNLRSALDIATYQLALVDTGKPGRMTCFPIYTTAKEYKVAAGSRLAGIAPQHRAFFESVQPYYDPARSPLADLAWLTNTDKHRDIHATLLLRRFDDACVHIAGDPTPSEIAYHVTEGVLQNGTELVRVRNVTGSQVEMHVEPTLEMAFGDRLLRQRELLVIHSRVTELIERMAVLFDR